MICAAKRPDGFLVEYSVAVPSRNRRRGITLRADPQAIACAIIVPGIATALIPGRLVIDWDGWLDVCHSLLVIAHVGTQCSGQLIPGMVALLAAHGPRLEGHRTKRAVQPGR